MNTQEQAYINGFVKRASEYGLNSHEALALLKAANSPLPIGQSPTDVAVREAVMAPINWAGDKLSQGASAIGDYFKNFNATHPRVGNAGAESQFARTLGKKSSDDAYDGVYYDKYTGGIKGSPAKGVLPHFKRNKGAYLGTAAGIAAPMLGMSLMDQEVPWQVRRLAVLSTLLGTQVGNMFDTKAERDYVDNYVDKHKSARTLGKKGNEIAPVSMPSRASLLNASAASAPVDAEPAPQPQPAAAIADPSLYQRLGVNFNGSPNYKSPANNPNEADQNDVLRFKR